VYGYVPLDAFMQVNTAVNRALVAALQALALEHDVKSFVDLYAGCGNFSLPLLAQGASGSAVEVSPSATYALSLAARHQRLERFEVRCGEVSSVPVPRADLMVIDAPRAGVPSGLATLASAAERQIALLSCNFATFARDLKTLDQSGFALRRLFLFDMFPHTRHFEMLAWLGRR
jgi:23S rRNA (uracil1939-C5)-methyltransferase